jgi:hypothetical protein
MSAQKARIYQRIENGEWRSTGKSTSTPEELVEGQTKSARGYKDQTSRTVPQ